jgi:hypothetical protein
MMVKADLDAERMKLEGTRPKASAL